MKKLIMAAFLLLLSWKVFAQDSTNYWIPVIEAIIKVESGGNPKAVSRTGAYVGILQISKGLVDDVNSYLRHKGETTRYAYSDRLNPDKSKEMFIIYQEKYNKHRSVEKAIRIWNGGPKHTIKGTQAYLKRVLRHLEPGEG